MSDNSQNIVDKTERWTEIEHLTEWDEEFYNVFTAKKFGKWVMLKTLRPELKDDPKYQAMIEKEFDVRYNLSHPNIVMINDFEDVPGIGRCIITDDVYGYSLRRLIDEKRLTPRIVQRLKTQLLDALDYIQENHIIHHPITPESIIFTEYNENLKLINVGYDQTSSLSPQDTEADIRSYGEVLAEVLDNLPESLPRLRRIADRATDTSHPYKSFLDLQLDMQRRSSLALYISLAAVIAVVLLLVWVLVAL